MQGCLGGFPDYHTHQHGKRYFGLLLLIPSPHVTALRDINTTMSSTLLLLGQRSVDRGAERRPERIVHLSVFVSIR